MQKIKDLIQTHKIHAAIVGGSLVIGGSFGQCVLSPPETVPTEAADEAPAEPATEAPAVEAEAVAEPAGDAGESSD